MPLHGRLISQDSQSMPRIYSSTLVLGNTTIDRNVHNLAKYSYLTDVFQHGCC
ncbi:hypothetical protein OF83DRAFT_1141881 [Amylostereum chailletii]|nr:hypothetical protein OF83DRAFT_1141881 [Amylostereum chailletii]